MNTAIAVALGWALGVLAMWGWFAWQKLIRNRDEWNRAWGRSS